MDLLQSYTDSDNEAKEDLKNTSSHKQKNLKCDFFSLVDSDEEDCNVPISECRKVVVNGLQVDVPEGAFWSEIDSKASTEDHDSYRMLQNNYDVKSEREIKTETEDKEKLVTESPITPLAKLIPESSPFYSTMGNNFPNRKRVAEFDSCSDSGLFTLSKKPSKGLSPAVESDKRNIFFIHGKIGSFLNRHVHYKCPKDVDKQWPGHNQVINRVQWNKPNYSHLVLSVSMDRTIKIWNVWSSLESCVRTITCHDKAVKDCVWDSSGEKLLSCSYDRSAALVCVRTGNIINRLAHEGYVSCCTYHPMDTNVVITGTTNKLLLWDLRTPNKPTSKLHYKEKIGQIQDVIFDQNGRTLFTCSDVVDQNSSDRNIMAWDYTTGAVLSNQIYEEKYTCNRLKLHSTDTTQFLAQSQGGYIAIFSTTRPYKMNKRKRFEGHKLQGRSIGFDISNDGNIVISGSCDRKLYCYNYTTGKLFKTLSTNLDFTDVAIHPVLPSVVIASSWDGQLQLLR